MATHSSVLAWRIPGTGEPGGLLSMGSHRVGHDWSNLAATKRSMVWQSRKRLDLLYKRPGQCDLKTTVAGFSNSCQYWLTFTFIIKLTAPPVCLPDIVLKSISSTLKLILLNYFNEGLLSIVSVFVEKHEKSFLLVFLESFISYAYPSRSYVSLSSLEMLFLSLCSLNAFVAFMSLSILL